MSSLQDKNQETRPGKKRDKKRRRSQTQGEGQRRGSGSSEGAKQKSSGANGKVSFPMGVCVHVSDRFEKVGRVGEGTYGVVYKARDRLAPVGSKTNDCFVALKRCIPHHQASDGFPITTLREIHSLRLLHHHPHIISLRQDISNGVAVSRHDVFLVFEYCEHDLGQLLDHYYHHPKSSRMLSTSSISSQKKKRSPFLEPQVKALLHQLLSALECIHSHGLIHRDLKLSNLLYTHKGQLKICDFGLSRTIPPLHVTGDKGNYHLTPNVVSLWYRPPELLLGSKQYHQSIDVWAAGCIFAELLQGYPLWTGSNESDQVDLIFTTLGVPQPSLWPAVLDMPAVVDGHFDLGPVKSSTAVASAAALLDAFSYLSPAGLILLTNLLHYNADEKRWTAAQALQSKYFIEVPLPTPQNAMPKFPSLHR